MFRDVDVGYHGLKDRHAISRQWFSLYLGKHAAPARTDIRIPGVKVLKIGKARRKLRRGDHWGNRFNIKLRKVEGDRRDIDEKFQQIKVLGFPNYFGAQRFGQEARNLSVADEWLRNRRRPSGRSRRGLVLSAARSYLFNRVLERRVLLRNWSEVIAGDRLIAGDLPLNSLPGCTRYVPSGPLLGGADFLGDEAGVIEKAALAGCHCWLSGLHREGVRTSRRALVAYVRNFSWCFTGKVLDIKVDLPPGVYASVLLEQVFSLARLS